MREFYIPNLKAKVRKYINLCKNCNTAKYDRNPYKIILPETPIPKNPLKILHIDIFIATPNLYLSAVDKFSKFGILIRIKSRTIIDMRKALIKLFSRYGKPKNIISDNEPALKSAEIRGLLEKINIETHYTPPNHSKSNGTVERYHSTLAEIFRCIKEKYKDLTQKEIFEIANFLYNDTIHSTTKLKPVEAFYAITNNERSLNIESMIKDKNEIFDEIILKLKAKQKKNLEQHNKKKEAPSELLENQEVYVKSSGIKSKIKNKFNALIVRENKQRIFRDLKHRKLHKEDIKRKT